MIDEASCVLLYNLKVYGIKYPKDTGKNGAT